MSARPVTGVQIVHFNDVYNIDEAAQEPCGGAARFVNAISAAVESYAGPSLVLFSGDAFSPAPLTPLTDGAEMPPVLNACGVHVACVGNHEFDRGLPVMRQRIAETDFPWLVSNVTERASGLPVGGVKDFFVLERSGVRFGFLGLASRDWLVTLDKVDPKELVYVDFVAAADRYSAFLKDEHQCDYIIALTHMRQPDDSRLAKEAKDVDLILGGHDHVVSSRFINGRYAVKSGTDFKSFSTIEVEVDSNRSIRAKKPVHHDVTSKVAKDPVIEEFVAKQLRLLGDTRWEVLASCSTPLDGRFLSIRTRETGLGNFIADVLAASMKAPIGLVNSGSFRSDSLEPPGEVNRQLIDTILPFHDEALLVELSGHELLAILENSVSQYPLLDGRFLQVSGVAFAFDPRMPPQQRLAPGSAEARGEDGIMSPIDEDNIYRCALKTYIFDGKDGYAKGDPENIVAKAGGTIPSMVFNELLERSARDGCPTEIGPKTEGRVKCLHPDKELLLEYTG